MNSGFESSILTTKVDGTHMKKFQKKALTGFAISVSAVALLAGAPVYAQDADADEEEVTVDEDGADGEEAEGNIVVTGSRIGRASTYSSPSPLQILTTEAERNVGNFDAAEILQRSEFSAGQQIDATFQGFVLNNGPGSQTLDLRGLGADRTLLMINSRRMAPAGVEGAPTNPSINLLPTSLISRYDLLLDGASSIYGSDAIAGVANIILRDDIDGFEVFASGNYNDQGGGDDYTVSGAWGTTFENGFFGIGAEYSRRDEVLLGDRDFLAGCDSHYEVDQDGNYLHQRCGYQRQHVAGQRWHDPYHGAAVQAECDYRSDSDQPVAPRLGLFRYPEFRPSWPRQHRHSVLLRRNRCLCAAG